MNRPMTIRAIALAAVATVGLAVAVVVNGASGNAGQTSTIVAPQVQGAASAALPARTARSQAPTHAQEVAAAAAVPVTAPALRRIRHAAPAPVRRTTAPPERARRPRPAPETLVRRVVTRVRRVVPAPRLFRPPTRTTQEHTTPDRTTPDRTTPQRTTTEPATATTQEPPPDQQTTADGGSGGDGHGGG
jgi:hypothetical protein